MFYFSEMVHKEKVLEKVPGRDFLPKGKENYLIAGVDEAGRGPLAGPVTAACVVLPETYNNPVINDSKKLSSNARSRLLPEILAAALAWSVVSVGQRRIDQLNIREATRLAMGLASARVAKKLAKKDKIRQNNILHNSHISPILRGIIIYHTHFHKTALY